MDGGLLATFGVCIGALAGVLGAGPSILTVLLLKHGAALDVGTSIATSLFVVALMSLCAVVPYAVARSIAWRSAVAFGLASMTGAFLAGRLSGRIPDRALLLAFLAAMVIAAIAMLVERPIPSEVDAGARSTRVRATRLAGLAGSGLVVGSITGLVGLGGGFAVVPLLVLLADVPIRAAIGTSLLVIAMNTLAGFAGHLPHPRVDWPVAGHLAIAECAGGLVGGAVARRVSAKVLRRGFAAIMLLGALFMLSRETMR